jgi:hypothetical protein
MEHIGIDVHKRDSQLCVITRKGEVLEQRIRTERKSFAELFGKRARARILVEASTESEWVARCLEGLGHEVVVGDPNFAPMYASRDRRVKTDRRDARALAEACRLQAYRPAHRISDQQHHVRFGGGFGVIHFRRSAGSTPQSVLRPPEGRLRPRAGGLTGDEGLRCRAATGSLWPPKVDQVNTAAKARACAIGGTRSLGAHADQVHQPGGSPASPRRLPSSTDGWTRGIRSPGQRAPVARKIAVQSGTAVGGDARPEQGDRAARWNECEVGSAGRAGGAIAQHAECRADYCDSFCRSAG